MNVDFRASLKLGLDKAVLQSMHGQQSSTTNGVNPLIRSGIIISFPYILAKKGLYILSLRLPR